MSKGLESLEDIELLKLIGDLKDTAALEQLYSRYRATLGSFLHRKLYQDKLVDEVYNDVMLTVWKKAADFRGDSKVSTWLFGIAYRMCLSYSRKELKHTSDRDVIEFDDIAVEQEQDLSLQLHTAITKLSDDHRSVIELAYFYGHSIAEISDVIQCPVNTVKTRLFHARQNLKNIIEKQ